MDWERRKITRTKSRTSSELDNQNGKTLQLRDTRWSGSSGSSFGTEQILSQRKLIRFRDHRRTMETENFIKKEVKEGQMAWRVWKAHRGSGRWFRLLAVQIVGFRWKVQIWRSIPSRLEWVQTVQTVQTSQHRVEPDGSKQQIVRCFRFKGTNVSLKNLKSLMIWAWMMLR